MTLALTRWRTWLGAASDAEIRYSAAASYDQMPALDGLRAASILMVFVSHSGFGGIVPGGFGVTVFFFVSGLLITRQLLAEIAATGTVSLWRFMMRRFLRLYPPLVLMVAVVVPVYLLIGGHMLRIQVISALLYLSNYAQLISGWLDNPATRHTPLDILWSLAVEEHFYLVFPLLILGLCRRPHRVVAGLMVVMTAVTLWRLTLAGLCQHSAVGVCIGGLPDRIEAATDTRVDSILYGALLAALLDGRWRQKVLHVVQRPAAFAAGIVLLLFSFLWRDPIFRDSMRYTVQGVGLLLVVGSVLFAPGLAWPRRILSGPVARLIGRWSYSIYLYHYAIIACCLQAIFGSVEPVAPDQQIWLRHALLLILPASLTLAALSYYGVERPVLRLRRRFAAKGLASH